MFADAAFDHAAFDVFDVGVLVRGVDVCDDVDINAETCGLRADCTLRYPFNNGYRSVFNGRFTSPDPLHMQTQLSHLGPAVYTYAANRPQMYQDPDGRLPPDSAMWDKVAELQLAEMRAALDVREFATREGREAAAAIPGATGGFSPTGDKCSDENALRHCIGSCIFFSEPRFGSSATVPMFIHEIFDWTEDSGHDRKNNLSGEQCSVGAKSRRDCVSRCVARRAQGNLSVGVGGSCTTTDWNAPNPYWPPTGSR